MFYYVYCDTNPRIFHDSHDDHYVGRAKGLEQAKAIAFEDKRIGRYYARDEEGRLVNIF